MPGCPFGGGGGFEGDNGAERFKPAPLQTGRMRVRTLYEEYIHLPTLRQVWESPSTERPVLEPCFAAGFHGIELAFLLLAQFVSDGRRYVAKRPRVELLADDIAAQCQLLTEVVDAELEEELQEGAQLSSRLSLTQPFPFEGCPPTSPEPGHSPGLQRLIDAIHTKHGGMTSAEQNSLLRVVVNITAAFGSFQRWTVGLGIEHQLNALREAVGLAPVQQYPAGRPNLDYTSLVKPWLCEQTLTCEEYNHAEDFFFRSIHLGTECWAFVVLSRMSSAQQLAAAGSWHVAAARATQAARILRYLGSHVLLLTSMNLRDYLLLKVEIEGTSGEGSAQVGGFRSAATALFMPLAAAVLGLETGSDMGAPGEPAAAGAERLLGPLMDLYESPDKQPGLYNYCKALEALETGLLGGFFYQHYCLAINVIGSEARGTMRRAVQALKSSYETPLFPLLDKCRVGLGARIEAELAHRKGHIMQAILAKMEQQRKEVPCTVQFNGDMRAK